MNVVFAVVIILVVLLCVILVGFASYIVRKINAYSDKFSFMRFPRKSLVDMYEHLKTGDVVLFASACQQVSNIVFAHTFFTHVGLICRLGDKLCVTESQGGTNLCPSSDGRDDLRMKPGIDTVPILCRFKYYVGNIYLMRLIGDLPDDDEKKIISEVVSLTSSVHEYPSPLDMIRESSTELRHCFQHVAHLLGIGGIVNLKGGCIEVCDEICSLGGKTLRSGHSYSNPVELLYDIY